MTSKKKQYAKDEDQEGQPQQQAAGPAARTEPQTATPAGEAVPALTDVQAELEKALAAAAKNEEAFLRAKAEMENIRRRAAVEVANARKYAIERFAAEMLAVKDSLDLAKAVGPEQDNKAVMEKMFEGLELTVKLMDGIFEKFSLQVIDPRKGDKFDPESHQAMSALESGEVAPNHVLSVVQKGYRLHDRLLRPAMVIVAKAESNKQSPGDSA